MASQPGDPSRVTLRPLTAADQDEFLALAAASADLHHPWMSLPVTPQEFQAYLGRFDHVTAVGLLICLRGTGAIVGVIPGDGIDPARPVVHHDPIEHIRALMV